MTDPAALALPLDTAAPRHAREFLRHSYCLHHHDEAAELARLLVSELVTNVVRHAAGPLVVHIACEAEAGLLVSVDDGGPAALTPRRPDADESGGRGLQLVEVISTAWGVQPDGTGGKTVWFRLTTPLLPERVPAPRQRARRAPRAL